MRDLTVGEVAKELRLGKVAVTDLMTAGELPAYDVASKSSKRPKYRVSRESLDSFKQGRSIRRPVSVIGGVKKFV